MIHADISGGHVPLCFRWGLFYVKHRDWEKQWKSSFFPPKLHSLLLHCKNRTEVDCQRHECYYVGSQTALAPHKEWFNQVPTWYSLKMFWFLNIFLLLPRMPCTGTTTITFYISSHIGTRGRDAGKKDLQRDDWIIIRSLCGRCRLATRRWRRGRWS